MIKPPRLRSGDTVAVIAPGGVVHDRAAHDRGVSALEALGYRVRLGASVGARSGYLAGDEAVRRNDLLDMFGAEDVRAIFCSRGGYGVTRLLPLLDLAALASRPKIFVGYSDVSPLLVALVQRGGLVAFHGPMVAADFGRAGVPSAEPGGRSERDHSEGLDQESSRQLVALLGGSEGLEVAIPTAVRPGVARGTLVGGCLSLLAATVGTPYMVRGEGTVLFLEDVGEPTYRIDRMITQLDQAGVFTGVRAVVFGTMPGCGARGGTGVSVHSVIEDLARKLEVPVGVGLPSGHDSPNFTLPFGVSVEVVLEEGGGSLRFEEVAVA
jgi:muramoyltetrapeptide carboxypeptidase